MDACGHPFLDLHHRGLKPGRRCREFSAWPRMGIYSASFFLNFSALLLNGHLIGMIGSARGRITPGLAQCILSLPPRSRAS